MEDVNALYWESDESVAGLARRLGISRSALYAAVQPLPLGAPCPECGGALVYTNRSARAAEQAVCSDCSAAIPDRRGAQQDQAEPELPAEEVALPAGEDPASVPVREKPASAPAQRAYLIAAAGSLGAAVGVAAVVLARRWR